MPRKCSVAFCRSNYDSFYCETSVYGFPKESYEREKWINALPNRIENPSKHMGVCRAHWPEEAPMKKVKRFERPLDPPSLFPNCSSSFTSVDRNVEIRGLSLSDRNSQQDELPAFQALDKLPPDWEAFLSALPQQPAVSGNNLVTVNQDNGVALLSFTEQLNIAFSVTITRQYKVHAKRSETTISLRHLLGFQHALVCWSQLEAIIHLVLQATPDASGGKHALISRYREIGVDISEEFLLQQLQLSGVAPNGRRYSPQMFLHALRFYTASKSGYRQLRTMLSLPHPKTLMKTVGPLHSTGGIAECEHMVESCFSSLPPSQKNCLLVFDEVYVKPSLRFRGGHVFGKAADDPNKLATTMLAILVKPLLGSPAFIARLIPVHSLTRDFLFEQLDKVVSIVNAFGGVVRAMVCDNHFINKQLYALMSAKEDKAFIGRTSTQGNIHLLYDTTHLLKNVRNNWLNEAQQQIGVIDPATNTYVIGKFSDVRHLWASECNNTVRTTNLSYSACYPSPLERQNFKHVAAVFNDKTVAALTLARKMDTARFVGFFLRLWKIVNVKSTTAHIRLNDADRRPITSTSDDVYVQLQALAANIRSMPGGRGPSRKRTLTTDTRDAVVQTVEGLLSLSKQLLALPEWNYVLLGMFQSDDLEGEFGIYREMCGGCYFISVDQILCTAHFRSLNILAGIRAPSLRNKTHSDCCTTSLTNDELAACDSCHTRVHSLSANELAALYFISGYIALKEAISGEVSAISAASEFTRLVSRGKLRDPPDWLFNFACLCLVVFEASGFLCCSRFIRLFKFIFDSYFSAFSCNSSAIARRLAQCFLKGLVTKSISVSAPVSSVERRKRKLAP